MSAEMHGLERWDDIRYFLAVARTGGLSAASRLLGVNQSTVFRRIGRLEDSLGARLFDRMARGYALTAVGEEMMLLATRVEDDVLALDRGVRGADRELRGAVRITSLDEVLERIAPHLKRFCDRYPGIWLEVSSETRVLSLSRRETDIAIRPGLKPTEPDVVGRRLVALPVAAYASAGYLEGRTAPGSVSDLEGHGVIGFVTQRGGGRDTASGRRGGVVFQANSMSAQAIAARAGLGVAILPRFMGDPDDALTRLFHVTPETVYHLWLLVHADMKQSARIRAFIDFLSEAITAERALYEGSAS